MAFDINNHFNIFSCYLRSASALHAQGIEASNKNSACGGGPVVAEYYYITALFLYRHTLELGIKALLKSKTGDDVTGHNIKKLWEAVSNGQTGISTKIQKAFAILAKHHILEDAQLFRYHEDKKGVRLQDMLPIEEESFEVLDQAAWAVYQEVCICEHLKKGFPLR